MEIPDGKDSGERYFLKFIPPTLLLIRGKGSQRDGKVGGGGGNKKQTGTTTLGGVG